MAFRHVLAGLLAAGVLFAEPAFFPLRDLRPGMKGVGRTVFAGGRIEEFQVEVLGVLENVGPKQSLVLARLSGGPLDRTGVLQGMSGSPVYFQGKLAGAVAMSFAFSKEPIAGIRPIEEMLRVREAAPSSPPRARLSPFDAQLALPAPSSREVLAGGTRMTEISTPVSFGGFTARTVETFAPQLRGLGLEPLQGISGGGTPAGQRAGAARLEPGSMISVQLLSGDMSIGADGTVTHVDGQRMLAFGHRFLSIGGTDLPFARAEVLTLLPNLSTSFKISSAREWMGSITEDRNTAIAGEIGRRAALVPVSIAVARPPGGQRSAYHMRMVNDRILSPFLLQMAVFSAIDATEQTLGGSSFAIRGEIRFAGGTAPVRLDNLYAGDFNLPMQVSIATAVPLSYILQSGFAGLQLKSVDLEIEAYDRKKQARIDQVWPSRREVKPGGEVELTVVLSGENGAEWTRKLTYRVPIGAPAGPLLFTVADANTINLTEYRQLVNTPPKSAAQLISFVNSLRPNDKAYVRVWRAEPGYEIQGETLPDPPPSLALILARAQPAIGGSPWAVANSKVAELEIDAGRMVISGAKTFQVEVKE